MKSYQEALNQYNGITKPPRSKKWKSDAMPDDGKPLRRVGETHYAIHKKADGTIYYRLYDTIIASFYPPSPDGTERRTFKYVSTLTTMAFMSENYLHFSCVKMDDGTDARIPYVGNGGWRDNDMVTADLVVDTEGRVIRSRSSHKDIYTMVSSDDDKAKRREFKKRLESLITLATFNMVNLQTNCDLQSGYGEPFGTAYNEPRNLMTLKRYIREKGAELEDNTFVELFMDGVQGAFDVYASKLAYTAGGWEYGRYYYNYETGQPNPDDVRQRLEAEHQRKIADIRLNTLANITPEGFTKSLTNMLLNAACLKTGSVKKPWGQFMPTLPVKWVN